MYYYLLSSLKRRLIEELKDSFAKHPLYAKIVPFIQNRFAFDERPQYGIVVKGNSASKVALSGDNFIGTVSSHVMLAYVGESKFPIEWVREDLHRVFINHGAFPTLPGIYFIEILTAPTDPQTQGAYVIDPLLAVEDEAVLRFRSGIEQEAQLQQTPAPGMLRLYENRQFLLREGRDYNLHERGQIELLGRHSLNSVLTADYYYATPSIGPVPFQWNTADFQTLPGVVLAFGKRAVAGDKVAIRVYPQRTDTANAYGGKFEVSFDFDVISRDPVQTEEIADLVVMFLWAQKKSQLETEGIEIIDISIGGESEDVYDDTGDLLFYNASISLQMRADWEVHVPLPLTISRVAPTTQEMDDAVQPDGSGPSQSSVVGMAPDRLFFSTDPVLVGRNNNFEKIT